MGVVVLRKKFIAAPLFRDFAMSGARIRLVQLEKERMAIHNEFPELLGDDGPKEVPKMPSTKSLVRTANGKRGKGKRRAGNMEVRSKVLALFQADPTLKIGPAAAAKQLGMESKQAGNAMYHMREAKQLKSAGRGMYKLPTTKKDEK